MSDRLFRDRMSDEDSLLLSRGSPSSVHQHQRTASPRPGESHHHQDRRSPRPHSRSPRPPDPTQRGHDLLHHQTEHGALDYPTALRLSSSSVSVPTTNASTMPSSGNDTVEFSPWPPGVFSAASMAAAATTATSSSSSSAAYAAEMNQALRAAVHTATSDALAGGQPRSGDTSAAHSPLVKHRARNVGLHAADAVMPTSATDHLDRSLGFGRFFTARGGGAPDTSESELKQKIQALEDTVAEYEKQKTSVMGTFAEYRERVAERERKLEADYSAKIISLSEDVLVAKKDFESRMKQFASLQERFQAEKEQSLEKLRKEHQKEIEMLERRMSQSQLLNLEQKYMLEIQRLEEERKALRHEKDRVGETFESKLRRAQSLYETELSAAKALYSKELEALKEHEAALKEELAARQEDFRERLDELQQQYAKSKSDLQMCRKEVAALEARLTQKQAQVQQISEELHGARNENDEALRRLREVSTTLEEKQHCQKETEERLIEKSNMLTVLECAKNKLEAVIQDLQVEVKSLKDKVCFLETERQNLESQSETQANLNVSQVQALEAVLETVTKEKELTKEAYEKRLEQERVAADEREFTIRRELGRKLDETEQSLVELKEKFDEKLSVEREQLRKKLDTEYTREVEQLKGDNESLEDEVCRLRSKLHNVLQQSTSSASLGGKHEKKDESPVPDRPRKTSDKTPGGEHISKLKMELETKDNLLHSSAQQCSELAGKAGSLRRALEDAEKELTRRQNIIEELTQRVTNTSTCDSNTGAGDTTFALNEQQLSAGKIAELEFNVAQCREQLGQAQAEAAHAKQQLHDRETQLAQQQHKINNMRGEIERELRSQFSEAAAECHVADVEAFEEQLQLHKQHADAKLAQRQEEIDRLKAELAAKEATTAELRSDVERLTGELHELHTDVQHKRREEQQQQAHAAALAQLQRECEDRVQLLTAKQQTLLGAIEALRNSYKDRTGEELEVKELEEEEEEEPAELVVEDDSEEGSHKTEGQSTEQQSDATADTADTAADSTTAAQPPELPLPAQQQQQQPVRTLAQLLQDKNDEIKMLKDLLREAQSSETARARGSRTRSPDSGRQRKYSDGKQPKEGSTGEQRLCQRAATLNKWHSLVDQLTAEGNAAATRHTVSSRAKSSSGTVKDGEATAETASDSGDTRPRDQQQYGDSSSIASSARDSSSPARARKSSASLEKRPAWKF